MRRATALLTAGLALAGCAGGDDATTGTDARSKQEPPAATDTPTGDRMPGTQRKGSAPAAEQNRSGAHPPAERDRSETDQARSGAGEAGSAEEEEPRSEPGHTQPREPRLRRARCPADAAPGCRSASGTIVYVERVDPDGDGDAHFVLAGDDSITAPGLSVIDVRRDLRPHPLPGPGDRVSAAGPVYRGSYGQRQIEAVVLYVAR